MDAPEYPDPKTTASAQSGMNREAAVSQFLLNATDQKTPYGSLTYKQTGNNFMETSDGQTYWRGPNGEIQTQAPGMVTSTVGGTPAAQSFDINGDSSALGYRGQNTFQPGATTNSSVPDGWTQVKGTYLPKYTAEQTFSPEQQALYDRQTALSKNLLDVGVTQSGRLNQLLGEDFRLPGSDQPFSLNNETTEARLMELANKRQQPELERRRAQMEQSLYNRGVRPGSEAYREAMAAVGRDENDAINQLLLTGRGQAGQELLTERNQRNQEYMTNRQAPINEILALASGTQLTPPSTGFVNTPGSQIAPPDYQGEVGRKYSADLDAYKSSMSGLFGLGSALIGGAFTLSDERAKEDIEKIGETDEGTNIYKYRYIGSPMMQIGVMAQEVAKSRPDAVTTLPSGLMAVDYAKVA